IGKAEVCQLRRERRARIPRSRTHVQTQGGCKVKETQVEAAHYVQELTHLLIAWELERACWRRRPERPAITGHVVHPCGVTESAGATHNIHLPVEGTRYRAEVIRNKRIGGQWRPGVTGDVVGCEGVGGKTGPAINDAGRLHERTGRPFTAKRHRRERCPGSRGEVIL